MSVILIRVCRGKQIKGSPKRLPFICESSITKSVVLGFWGNLVIFSLFYTFHHLLQQWTEAEEEDGCNSSHDSKECEEVCEVGDLIAKE